MNTLLAYNLKVALGISIFYIGYQLLFSNDTLFVRNRFYLLCALIAPFFIPLINIPFRTHVVYLPVEALQITTSAAHSSTLSRTDLFYNLFTFSFLAGILIMLFRLIWAYRKVFQLVKNADKQKLGKNILAITPINVLPFSLIKWIVVPDKYREHPDIEQIVQHETVHCRQYHSFDLFLAEMIVMVQWFNPFAWWLKKAIAQNHEYIVDNQIIINGTEARSYQYSLLQTAMGGQRLLIANHFSTNLLKKRIKMMNKSKSPKWHLLKNFALLVPVAVVFVLTATTERTVIAQTSSVQNAIQANTTQPGSASLTDTLVSEPIASAPTTPPMPPAPPVPPVEVTVNSLPENTTVYVNGKQITIKDVKDQNLANTSTTITVCNDSTKAITVSSENKKTLCVVVSHKDQQQENNTNQPLCIVNGKRTSFKEIGKINSEDIESISVLKNENAIITYGEDGRNGVIMITLKRKE